LKAVNISTIVEAAAICEQQLQLKQVTTEYMKSILLKYTFHHLRLVKKLKQFLSLLHFTTQHDSGNGLGAINKIGRARAREVGEICVHLAWT
jgi:hypothetical protein